MTNSYSSEQIQVLEGLDAVRKRPGMYIGSTGEPGLHHLITEIINNSMDEAMGGFATHIRLDFLKDGSTAIYDNGRGVPFDIKKEYGVSALQLVYTELHAGGKFGGGGYKVASGLHGVGSSVVNALSEWMRVVVKRGDKIVIQEYEKGGKVLRPVEDLNIKKPISKIKGVDVNLDLENWQYESGTIVQFLPDASIFETTDFKLKFFLTQIKEYAYLTPGVKFEINDERVGEHLVFYFEGGLKAYLKALNRNKKIINETPFVIRKEVDDVDVEVGIQYTDAYGQNLLSFANNLRTQEGGTHLTGFKTALTKSINDYAKANNLVKDTDNGLMGDDILEGITAIVSVRLDSMKLQFEGQTKGKLGSSVARPAVETVVKEGLEQFLGENPKDAKAIIEKNLIAYKARLAAKAARDSVIRKSALEGGGVLPGKLADCSTKDKEKSELFIVEGDSAAGPAKDGRDRVTQAILPMFGKIINTEKARLDKIVESEKFKTLIIAVGGGIGDLYNPERLRYGKIIVMADADIDGQHIMTLYLTFFYRHMVQLVQEGRVYLAVPPLYKATWGKEKKYLFDDKDLEAFNKTPNGPKATIQRFKGLGEMNSDELWETTMNPQTRRLKKIQVDDAAKADEIFTMLMGQEVAPRKRFIQANAKYANIDVAG